MSWSGNYKAAKQLIAIVRDDPHLTVIIKFDDECPKTFYPGASGRATITFLSATPRVLYRPHVNLVGQVATYCTRWVTMTGILGSSRRLLIYRGKEPLFCITKSLGNDISLQANIPWSSDIDFVFPEHSALGPDTSNLKPLPPSFLNGSDSLPQACVQYCLQAVVSLWGSENLCVRRSGRLGFRPFGSPNSAPPRPFEIQGRKHSYASRRLVGESKSLALSLHDAFSGHTPSVEVLIKASTDIEQVVGKEFLINVSVEIGTLSNKAIRIPAVDIRIASLKLVAVTELTGEKINHPEIPAGEQYWKSEEDEVMLNTLPDLVMAQQQSAFINGQDGLLYQAVFKARAPADTTPSFRTNTVIRSYRLKMEVKAEVCGKTFKQEFTVPNVVFSSNINREDVPQESSLSEGWEHMLDPPPIYTQTEQDEQSVENVETELAAGGGKNKKDDS